MIGSLSMKIYSFFNRTSRKIWETFGSNTYLKRLKWSLKNQHLLCKKICWCKMELTRNTCPSCWSASFWKFRKLKITELPIKITPSPWRISRLLRHRCQASKIHQSLSLISLSLDSIQASHSMISIISLATGSWVAKPVLRDMKLLISRLSRVFFTLSTS